MPWDVRGKRIHFMGAGGIGMSALAELAAARGAVVSGCDREDGENLARLRGYGLHVTIGHDPKHAESADLLVYTSATPPDHPERTAAAGRTMRRGTFLAKMMEGYRGVGIAGTHGKTTTTWMTANLLIRAGLDPTVVLGGVVAGMGGNLRIGGGDIFVAELDESDESFLEPNLEIAAVTNVDCDHLHHYGTFKKVREAFAKYAAGVAESGVFITSHDDPEARAIFERHDGRKVGVGLHAGADLRAVGVGFRENRQQFHTTCEGGLPEAFKLRLPGDHNVRNALVAMAVGFELGLTPDVMRSAFEACEGVDRRMQRLGTVAGAVLFTDYAHHPTEIRASLQAARALAPGKVLVAFQPHLFSRTRDLATEFGAALAEADEALVVDIYPAREAPIPGVTSALLADAIRTAGGRAAGPFPLEAVAEEMAKRVSEFSAAILMGAGDIGTIGHDDVERCLGPRA